MALAYIWDQINIPIFFLSPNSTSFVWNIFYENTSFERYLK